jgi:hypothetical protein
MASVITLVGVGVGVGIKVGVGVGGGVGGGVRVRVRVRVRVGVRVRVSLGAHLPLVLLAEEVADDRRRACCAVHLLDLLVLDVAAQREATNELVVRHGQVMAVAGALALGALAASEGALDVDQ